MADTTGVKESFTPGLLSGCKEKAKGCLFRVAGSLVLIVAFATFGPRLWNAGRERLELYFNATPSALSPLAPTPTFTTVFGTPVPTPSVQLTETPDVWPTCPPSRLGAISEKEAIKNPASCLLIITDTGGSQRFEYREILPTFTPTVTKTPIRTTPQKVPNSANFRTPTAQPTLSPSEIYDQRNTEVPKDVFNCVAFPTFFLGLFLIFKLGGGSVPKPSIPKVQIGKKKK